MSEYIKIMLNQDRFALNHIRLFLRFLTLNQINVKSKNVKSKNIKSKNKSIYFSIV